jgi:hypothetical protein
MRWAARFVRQAVRKPRPQARRKAPRLRVECLEAREVPHVTGTAFLDLNLNGFQDVEDVGVAGVTVTATDPTGDTRTATTGADGTYTVEADADDLRVEFSDLPDGTLPGRVTDTSGPLVRFLAADSDRSAVDLALSAPQLATTQFFYDDALAGMNVAEGAVVAVPYGSDNSVTPTVLAYVADVGSVWGLAYQPSSNSLFASSFLKRHAGLGPAANGTAKTTGGIYRIDPTATNPVALLIDLNAAGAGLGTGANPHPSQPDPDGDWFHDAATLPLVGKRGLGGLAISGDGRTLYTVNLNTRELVEIPLDADGTRDTGRAIRHTPIPLGNPTGSGIGSFNASDLRPFAVAVRGTAVLVGVTYTAETSGNAADLRAFVYAFDPNQGAFRSYNQADGKFTTAGVSPVLTVNLTYPRGLADDPSPDDPSSGDEVPATWKAWASTFRTDVGQDGFPVHPSPWLTDIAVDGPNMVLGIRDRFGDQGGFQTGNAAAGSEDQFSVIAAGDILRAAPGGTGWVLESNGSSGGVTTAGAGNGQGPGGGEFYYQDGSIDPVPQDVATGGLAQVPGFHTIAATGNDPSAAFTGGIYTLASADAGPLAPDKAAGMVSATAVLYESFDLSTFGSANGLGDLAVLPADGAVQAGDRVFADADGNGRQDAGEAGISGVVLVLSHGGTQLDSVTTGAGGDYLFDGLAPNTAYEVRIDTTQAALAGRTLAAANQGADDQFDSDATLSGTTAVMTLTTGDAGTSNHSLDVGFAGTEATTPTLTLGNLVFADADNDGTFDAGETGVAGVTVELLDAAGTTAMQTTTTAAGGLYSFSGLAAGTYRVRLAAADFAGSGPLAGFISSSASSTSPDDDVNGNDDGAGSGAAAQSGPITLTVGGEPTTDGDGDANTNLTLDFGVVPPAAPTTLTLGDTVFRDANNNGTQNAGEAGLPGVTVELLDPAGSNVLNTTTTNAAGAYAFAGLAAGAYRVRLAPANFNAGEVLANFTPSTTAAADPNTDADKDSNGSASGTLGGGGFVVSGPIALVADGEPTTDGDADPNTNLSLDFGLVPPAAVGTLSLGGTVWTDANNNGQLDTGEAGVGGVTVQLLNATGTVLQTATTGADGTYSFTAPAAGDYKVRLPAADFTGTGPLVGFTSSTGANGSLTGAFEGSPTPDPDTGADGDDNGKATDTLGTTSGFVETALTTLAAGAAANTSIDLGVFQKLSLGNTVFNDTNNNGTQDAGESGIANVSVRLLDADHSFALVATTTTNAQGQYLFTNLLPGNYAVDLADTNFRTGGVLFGFQSSAGPSNAFEPAPAGATDRQDHGTATGPLGSGGSVQSRTIALSAAGPTGESPNTDPDTPDAQSDQTADFGLFQQSAATGRLSGRVFLDFNNDGAPNGPDSGVSGVTLSLSDGGFGPVSVQTDAAGDFVFNNLPAGVFTLTETQPAAPAVGEGRIKAGNLGGFINNGTPNTISSITLMAGEAGTGYTFAEVPLVSTGGLVYEDVNGNGVREASEPGIPGATLTLTGSAVGGGAITPKTATTGADGSYAFTGLVPGTYAIAETQPTGFTDGKESNGNPPAATVTNDRFAGIDLTSLPTSVAFNFGEVKGASLSGFVYADANNDGAKAATGEPGIAGVKVRVVGTDDLGHAVDQARTTGPDGSYLFGSLRPGTYRVVETQPAGYADGKEASGTPAGSTATNDQVTGVQLASGTTATGYLFGEQPRVDLGLTQSPASATLNPGGMVTMTYTLRNKGTATATAAAVTVNVGGLTFVSASVAGEFNATTKTWAAGELAAGATKTIRLTFRAPAAGMFAASAHATTTATELGTANNNASSTIAVGVAIPDVVTSGPKAHGFLAKLTWFLSSSTNARRGRR